MIEIESLLHGFDDVQREAFVLAFQKQVSLIQGPPGTGKTFIGAKIAKSLLMLKNKFGNIRGPIILTCYTNHALDQFLRMILQFTKKVVRMGGRTKDEVIA